MLPPKVTMTVRKISDFACVVDIVGEITAAADNALMDAYTQATTEGALFIVLNFSRLEYMNSSGIGLLVTLLIRVNRHKQKLLVYGLTDHYRQIFELTRLNEAIQILESETDALERVRLKV
jgi:anti-sigma B factor antagonist